jgi:hypothetical protein
MSNYMGNDEPGWLLLLAILGVGILLFLLFCARTTALSHQYGAI